MPSTASLILLIIAGLCLQSAVSHLIAWYNRRDNRMFALFGFLCFLGFCYALATVFSFRMTTYEDFQLADSYKRLSLRFLTGFLPWFLAYYADRKPGWMEKSLSVGFIGLEFLTRTVPGADFYSRVETFNVQIHPWGGPLPVVTGVMGWSGYALYLLYLLLMAYTFWIGMGLVRQRQVSKGWGLLGTLAVVILAYIHDLRLDLFDISGADIGEYAIFLFLVVVGIDLSVRRLKAEKNYLTLFHSVNDAIFVHDAVSGQVLDVNETARRMYRASREHLMSAGAQRFTENTDRHNPQAALDRIHRAVSEGPQVFEWRARRADGTRFWSEVALRSADIDGRSVVIATVRDIDERINDRKAVAEGAELNRAIVEGFDGYIYICSRDHRIEYMNQRLIDLVGFDGMGRLCYETLHGLSDPCPWCVNDRVFKGEKIHWEIQSPKDGRWHDVYDTPLHHPDGTVSKLSLFRDITDRKLAERERGTLLERIHQAEKMESLGVLAGGTAHDFNNLLTAILGNADLVAETVDTRSPALAALEKLKAAARRAADLARQLLAYSGRGRFKMVPIPLNDTVREVAEMLRVSLPAGIRLDFRLDPTEPLVLADATQLRQVAMNLLTNAAESMEGRPGTIAFSTRVENPPEDTELEPADFRPAPGGMVLFEVRDQGRGMDEETRRKVFEPFYSTKFAGRGLGMAAVLGIVRSHRGAIRVESEPKKGTVLKLWFVKADASPENSVPIASIPPSAARKALVVDDEPMVCDAVAGVLRSLGWQAFTVTDGASAVEFVRKSDPRPDLVLLDLTMPRLDGRQTAKLIKEISPRLPIIIMSGALARPEDDPVGFSDTEGFLPKPFTLPDLKIVLSRITRR